MCFRAVVLSMYRISLRVQIFSAAGMSRNGALASMVVLGIAKFCATAAATLLVDTRSQGGGGLGRKRFLYRGSLGMAGGAATAAVGFCMGPSLAPSVVFIGVITAVAAYASSFGPVAWIVLTEMFPTAVRGRALGVSTVVNWLGSLLVGMTFLSVMEGAGFAAGFALCLTTALVGLGFVALCVPETEGRTPEEVGALEGGCGGCGPSL
jgi:MFS family permease